MRTNSATARTTSGARQDPNVSNTLPPAVLSVVPKDAMLLFTFNICWPVCTDAFTPLSSVISSALCLSTRAVCYSATNSQKSDRSQQSYALEAQHVRRALAHGRERSGHPGGDPAPQAGP